MGAGEVTLRLMPGKHTLEAYAPRHKQHRVEVEVAEGRTTTVTLPLVLAPPGEAEPGTDDGTDATVEASAQKDGEKDVAASKRDAREQMKAGRALEAEGNFAVVLEQYELAARAVDVPSTGLSVARMLEKLGRLVEARDMALRVARSSQADDERPVIQEARQQALALAAGLEPRIARLQVVVTGLAATARFVVRIDDIPAPPEAMDLPRALDPGEHRVVVASPGFPAASHAVTLAEGEAKVLPIRVERSAGKTAPAVEPAAGPARAPEAAAMRSRAPAWSYGAMAAGAVGLATGAAAGWVSIAKSRDLADSCSGSACPLSAKEKADSAYGWAMVSNVALGAGAVALGAGLLGAVFGRESFPDEPRAAPPPVSVRPAWGPTSVGLTGIF